MEKLKIPYLRKLEYHQRPIQKGCFQHKCQASEKFAHFYALTPGLGILLHELLRQCVAALSRRARGTV